jgi:hypothetical protein
MTRRNREEYGTNGSDVQLCREDNRCDVMAHQVNSLCSRSWTENPVKMVKEEGVLKAKHETSYSTSVHDFWSSVVFLIRLSSSWNLFLGTCLSMCCIKRKLFMGTFNTPIHSQAPFHPILHLLQFLPEKRRAPHGDFCFARPQRADFKIHKFLHQQMIQTIRTGHGGSSLQSSSLGAGYHR